MVFPLWCITCLHSMWTLKKLLPYFPQLLSWAIQGHHGPLVFNKNVIFHTLKQHACTIGILKKYMKTFDAQNWFVKKFSYPKCTNRWLLGQIDINNSPKRKKRGVFFASLEKKKKKKKKKNTCTCKSPISFKSVYPMWKQRNDSELISLWVWNEIKM